MPMRKWISPINLFEMSTYSLVWALYSAEFSFYWTIRFAKQEPCVYDLYET